MDSGDEGLYRLASFYRSHLGCLVQASRRPLRLNRHLLYIPSLMSLKEDRLFAPAPRGRGMDNAIVGGHWARRYTYVNGYYHAALVLARAALGNEPQDLLFYPIFYNYRHCVELHLKAMVVEAEALHSVMERMGETVDALPSKPKKMMKKHSLSSLLGWLEKALTVFSDEKMDPMVRKAIFDLDRFDFDGQASRYEARQDGSPTMPDQTHIDVRNLMDRMERVHFRLAGIAMWMADRRETALSVIADPAPDYSDYY